MTRWSGKGDKTHWNDGANWAGGVPGAGVDASFSGGAESVLLTQGTPYTTGALLVSGNTLTLSNGALNLAPAPAQHGNTFDLVLSHGADLTIAAGARLVGSHVAEIGNGSGATLRVLGTVAEEYGVVMGGTLVVDGQSGHWLSGDSGLELEGGSLVVAAGGHVDTGGRLGQFPAAALEMDGNSSGLITGPGSVVRVANVFLAEFSGTGTLTVQDGAQVFTGGGDIGGMGDGSLVVSGSGALFQASRGLTIGGQVPVNSSLTIENSGSVAVGRYGLTLNGTLLMDGSAHLTAPDILSGGGTLKSAFGMVDLASRLELYSNPSDPDQTHTTYLEAAFGATLDLSGGIGTADPGDTAAVLDAASGTIVLSHSAFGFAGTTQIYAATLEIAAQGAAGGGGVQFIGGADQSATLRIDAGLTFHNIISDFAAGDTIDLPGIAWNHAAFGFIAVANGATLRITDADHHVQLLHLAGDGLSAGSYGLESDGNGGTALIHH